MKEQSDKELLRAVVAQRDEAAFGELCKRHQARAFNLAFCILRNHELTEDAVQEAMLSLWQLSEKSLPADDAGNWIQKVAINKSLHLRRSQKNRAEREERNAMERSSSEPVSGAIEQRELIEALRRQIALLPELEATLLTCSFGANMSHEKIAEQVEMPRQTVSHKIQQTLEKLRSELSKAGFAAAVPLISSENLFEAITAGESCPAGMTDRLIGRIRHTGSKPIQAPSPSAGNWAVPAGLIIVAAAGVSWWANQGGGNQPPKQSAVQTASEDEPIHARWVFDKGPAQDLKVAQGNWTWKSTANGGQMTDSGALSTLIELPVKLPRHPVVIRIRLNIDKKGEFNCEAYWGNIASFVPVRQWLKYIDMTNNSGPPPLRATVVIYLSDRYIVQQWNGATYFAREANSAYPARELTLAFHQLNIEEIAMDSLTNAALPEILRDIPKTIRELGVSPSDCDEHGRVTPVKDAK